MERVRDFISAFTAPAQNPPVQAAPAPQNSPPVQNSANTPVPHPAQVVRRRSVDELAPNQRAMRRRQGVAVYFAPVQHNTISASTNATQQQEASPIPPINVAPRRVVTPPLEEFADPRFHDINAAELAHAYELQRRLDLRGSVEEVVDESSSSAGLGSSRDTAPRTGRNNQLYADDAQLLFPTMDDAELAEAGNNNDVAEQAAVSIVASSSQTVQATPAPALNNPTLLRQGMLAFAHVEDVDEPLVFVEELTAIAQVHSAPSPFRLRQLDHRVIDLSSGNHPVSHDTLLAWARRAFPDASDPRFQFISGRRYDGKLTSELRRKLGNALHFLDDKGERAQRSFVGHFAAGTRGFGGQCGEQEALRMQDSLENRLEYGLIEGLSTQNISANAGADETASDRLNRKIATLTMQFEMQRLNHWFDQLNTNSENTMPYLGYRRTYCSTGAVGTGLPGNRELRFDVNALLDHLHTSLTALGAGSEIKALRSDIATVHAGLVYANPNPNPGERTGQLGHYLMIDNPGEAFIVNDAVLPLLLVNAGIASPDHNGRFRVSPSTRAFDEFSTKVRQIDLADHSRELMNEILNLARTEMDTTVPAGGALQRPTSRFLAPLSAPRNSANLHANFMQEVRRQRVVDAIQCAGAQGSPNLNEIILRGVDLDALNLSRVRLSRQQVLDIIHTARNRNGVPNLRGVNLDGVDLRDCDLIGADFSRARLQGTDFSGADLSWADLSGVEHHSVASTPANFNGATLDGATFSSADLGGARFSGAILSREQIINLIHGNRTHSQDADFVRISFAETNCSDADLSGLDLRGMNFARANLSGANLSRANLRGIDLTGADLSGADVSEVSFDSVALSLQQIIYVIQSAVGRNAVPNVQGVNFRGIACNGVQFGGAQLSRQQVMDIIAASASSQDAASLNGANLGGIALSGINLNGVDLSGARLAEANIEDANFRGTRLSRQQVVDIIQSANARNAVAPLGGAILDDVDFSGINLARANLSDVQLSRQQVVAIIEAASAGNAIANLRSTNLVGVDLNGVVLSNADLNGVRLSRQQVMDVIQTANARNAVPNLRGVDLSHLDLRNVDLTGVDFTEINIHGVQLSQQQVLDVIRNANMVDVVPNLSGANLRGIILRGADLREVNLSATDFVGAVLSGAELVNANLQNTNLSGSDLSFAKLSGVDLRTATLERINLSGTDLSGTNLSGANISSAVLSNTTNFSNANLTGVDLSRLHLNGANLCGALITNANLSETVLSRQQVVDIIRANNGSGCNFSGANLSNIDLSGVNFRNSNLSQVDFRNAILKEADLTDATITDANFQGAKLTKVKIKDSDAKTAGLKRVFSIQNLGLIYKGSAQN